jgi:ribosome-binding factor A
LKHYRRDRSGSPSLVDPDFAQALDGGSGAQTSADRHAQHKARQLCRQVQRALNLALANRYVEEGLDELFVDAVTPAPDCGRLLVHVVVPADRSVADALGNLRRDAAYLRSQVAMAITRKRAPELSFVRAWRDGGD